MFSGTTRLYFLEDGKKFKINKRKKIIVPFSKSSISNLFKNDKENRSWNDLDRYNIIGYNAQTDLHIKSYVIGSLGPYANENVYLIETLSGRKIKCSPDTEFLMANKKNFGCVLNGYIKKEEKIRIFDTKKCLSKSDTIIKILKLENMTLYDVIVFGDIFVANEFIVRSSKITQISTL